MDVSAPVNLSGLLDDAKCFELVRQHRWPVGVRCPGCDSSTVIRLGLRAGVYRIGQRTEFIAALLVLWRLRYALSLLDLSEMFQAGWFHLLSRD
jgi:hypothetical protein